MAMALFGCLGTRAITRRLCAMDRQQRDWSAEYKLYSRSPWRPTVLFESVFEEFVRRYPDAPPS